MIVPQTVKVKPFEVKFLEVRKASKNKNLTYRDVKKIMISSSHTDKAIKLLKKEMI